MKTIEEYLKDFPNASLAQYKEYCDDYKQKQFETEKQSKENYVGWLESMEGKWFVLSSTVISIYESSFKNSLLMFI